MSRDDMAAAADLFDAINALHTPEVLRDPGESVYCCECDTTWPCPTARLLHPAPEIVLAAIAARTEQIISVEVPSPDSPHQPSKFGDPWLRCVKCRQTWPCESAPSPDSPADKPCETCGGSGRAIEMPANADASWVPCPSCRGGEPNG
jgi:hypothetical protein